MTSEPTAPAELVDVLVAVARLRLGLPRGEPAEVRAFYPEDIEGLWTIPLFDGERGRVVVVATQAGEVAAHAGLDRAAARWQTMFPPSHQPSWLVEEIAAVLDAVGGLTPGMPRYPSPTASTLPDGGVRLVLDEPASWVQFAAAGARGAPPPEGGSGGGVTHAQETGRIQCDVSIEARITWCYELEDVELARYEGAAQLDAADEAPPLLAEQLIAAARTRTASPLAVPGAPVSRAAGQPTGSWTVDLIGLGAIVVDEAEVH